MPCTREELEQRERQTLAPYAQLSAESRGRVYPEEPPRWRTQYQRDRDRVIHSRAFRRLEYKTQVFLNGSGDHLRTRLTHTMEVAAISRGIARALKLNEDLAEAIALAHDLGHSPVGHKGETVLNRLMKDFGGFEHNVQSLRIVELLEQKYPHFQGLNLTWEVREGLRKHQTSFDHPDPNVDFPTRHPSLEAQVANLADELTYYSHDLDDGLDCGLLSETRLVKDVAIFSEASRLVKKQYGLLPDETRRFFIIRCLIDWQVQDVVETSEHYILASGVQSADDARRQKRGLIRHSRERREMNNELRRYLFKNLYYNPVVQGPNVRAVKMLEELFHYYVDHPAELNETRGKTPRSAEWYRGICDYLSGMTDLYTISEHARLLGKTETRDKK
jgi:dGTPase